MKKRLFTVAENDPKRLVEALALRLDLACSIAESLVRHGAVQVDRKRANDPNAKISVGGRITVFQTDPPAEMPLEVIYRDEWLVVVNKPAGMASQATPGERASALDARVQAEIAPEARLLHRLDRDASGLVLFGTHDRSCAGLQAALTGGQIDRRYLAVAASRLEGEGHIDLKIGRDRHDRRRRTALPRSHPAGEPATSHYRVLKAGDRETLVALTLETGRTHQLRVHLSAIGHPIVGDRLYGGPSAPRLLLHAVELRLNHPSEGRPLVLAASLPKEFEAHDLPEKACISRESPPGDESPCSSGGQGRPQ